MVRIIYIDADFLLQTMKWMLSELRSYRIILNNEPYKFEIVETTTDSRKHELSEMFKW